MPRHDPLLPASSSSALFNDAFILEEMGIQPQSLRAIKAQIVGECMAERLSQLCIEGAAAHLRNK